MYDNIVRVRVSELYYRPAEVDLLIGNPSKAIAKLGFNPQSTPFKARGPACISVKLSYV